MKECDGCKRGLAVADDNPYLKAKYPESRGYHWSFKDVGDSTRKFEGMCERPVSPTASGAREWRLRELPHTKNQVITSIAPCDLDDILEAYASSQADKVRGLGQEAAQRIANSDEVSDMLPPDEYIEKAGAIIDQVIAERLKK